MPNELLKAIDALLPQTQCGKCEYDGCLPYAKALVNNEADINKCAPGGVVTMEALAHILNKPKLPLLVPEISTKPKTIAKIQENSCIGCTLCIKACPTDAIVGSGKLMHSVISEDCTGCELCIAPCPMDCIEMISDPLQEQTWIIDDNNAKIRSDKFRDKYNKRQIRQKLQDKEKIAAKKVVTVQKESIKNDIAAALLRVKSKQNHESTKTHSNL